MTKARDIATSEVVTGEIGSTIQAHDADLDSIAALDNTDGNVIVGDGTNWVAESGATARSSLGLGTAATTASTDYATAAQGALAATALQPTGDGSGLTGIAGGFSNLQVFNSSGTWTNPGNVQKVKVTVTGGGGGGGRGPTNRGGAGGAGGSAIEVIPFPSGTNVPVTVGAGGNLNASGGTSSFGSYCSATGGSTSPNPSPSSNLGKEQGGFGGAGSGGGINISGGDGDSTHAGNTPSYNYQSGGVGGASLWGGGGRGSYYQPSIDTPAQNGKAYGSGGGGSISARGTSNGSQAGKAGIVIVEY